MSGIKQNILNFIEDYYAEYNSLIENYIQNMSSIEKENNELKDKLFNNLIKFKKKHSFKTF